MDFSVTFISDSSRTTAEFIYVHFLNIKTSITEFLKAISDEPAPRSKPIMFLLLMFPAALVESWTINDGQTERRAFDMTCGERGWIWGSGMEMEVMR